MNRCSTFRNLISRSMDELLTGQQRTTLAAHLAECDTCMEHAHSLRQTQNLVAGLGRIAPPADLALRLRVALSRERNNRNEHRMHSLLTDFRARLNSLMVPATGGVLTAMMVFGLILGFMGVPLPVNAGGPDIPTLLYSPPKLSSTPMPDGVMMLNTDTPMIIEAFVDSNGKLADYRILAGRDDEETRRQLNRALIFTTFIPARNFGAPAPGRVVMTFANVNVKG